MDMDDVTNPVVLAVAIGLWLVICILLWKIPNAWELKQKIMITLVMLPITIAITASMSSKGN